MTAVLDRSALAIPLDPALEAHEPPEVRGHGRDDVRLLVSTGTPRSRTPRSRSCPKICAPATRS